MSLGNLRADKALDGLIWLVLAIVWVLVQVAGRAARQSRRGPAAPRPAAPLEPSRNLEDFLRSLGAEPSPPLPPITQTASQEAPSSLQPPVRPGRRRERPVATPPQIPAIPEATPESARSAEARQVGPPPLPDLVAPKTARQLLGKVVIPKIPVLRVTGMQVLIRAFQGGTLRTHQRGPAQSLLRGRPALRRAMLHRLILEPPHAFRF